MANVYEYIVQASASNKKGYKIRRINSVDSNSGGGVASRLYVEVDAFDSKWDQIARNDKDAVKQGAIIRANKELTAKDNTLTKSDVVRVLLRN